MPKGNFFSDTADDLLEFGISTAKSIPAGLNQTFNPLKGNAEKVDSNVKSGNDTNLEKLKSLDKKPNSTDLNLKSLDEKYLDQDKIKMEAMKHKLFKRVKDEEEKAIWERKREDQDRKQKEFVEDQEKKQKEEQVYQQQSMSDAPQGKVKPPPGMTHQKAVTNNRPELKGAKTGG